MIFHFEGIATEAKVKRGTELAAPSAGRAVIDNVFVGKRVYAIVDCEYTNICDILRYPKRGINRRPNSCILIATQGSLGFS